MLNRLAVAAHCRVADGLRGNRHRVAGAHRRAETWAWRDGDPAIVAGRIQRDRAASRT